MVFEFCDRKGRSNGMHSMLNSASNKHQQIFDDVNWSKNVGLVYKCHLLILPWLIKPNWSSF